MDRGAGFELISACLKAANALLIRLVTSPESSTSSRFMTSSGPIDARRVPSILLDFALEDAGAIHEGRLLAKLRIAIFSVALDFGAISMSFVKLVASGGLEVEIWGVSSFFSVPLLSDSLLGFNSVIVYSVLSTVVEIGCLNEELLTIL